MLLQTLNKIEKVVESLSLDHRVLNDHSLNTVIQFETDSDSFKIILEEIRKILPSDVAMSWVYQGGSYEITFYKVSNMSEYTMKSILLNAAIENEFAPLDWVDITVYDEDGTGSISFTGPHVKDDETCKSAGFIGRQDGFFSKMHKIKNMIQNCGYSAELIKFEADKLCPYSEATININFEGGEL